MPCSDMAGAMDPGTARHPLALSHNALHGVTQERIDIWARIGKLMVLQARPRLHQDRRTFMDIVRARSLALIMLLALMVTLALSLAACNGYQSSPSSPGAPTPTQGSGY